LTWKLCSPKADRYSYAGGQEHGGGDIYTDITFILKIFVSLKNIPGAISIYPCLKITHRPFSSGLPLQLEGRQGGSHACHTLSHTSSMDRNIFPVLKKGVMDIKLGWRPLNCFPSPLSP
jgi:hypothetical protein